MCGTEPELDATAPGISCLYSANDSKAVCIMATIAKFGFLPFVSRLVPAMLPARTDGLAVERAERGTAGQSYSAHRAVPPRASDHEAERSVSNRGRTAGGQPLRDPVDRRRIEQDGRENLPLLSRPVGPRAACT